MNFYMGLLVERSKKEGYPAVYAFNTFFYSKLISTSHKGVKKWTKGVDIFEHDVILVPIHLRIHWTLLVSQAGFLFRGWGEQNQQAKSFSVWGVLCLSHLLTPGCRPPRENHQIL